MPSDQPAVQFDDVTRTYRNGTTRTDALANATFSIATRSMTAIAGPSGSGKSTLLTLVACVDRPDHGSITVLGRDVTAMTKRQRRMLRRTQLPLLAPIPSDNLLPGATAQQNLTWTARNAGRALSTERTAELLDLVKLPAGTHRTHELSGGEQQRLAIACLLTLNPAIIVADEPTASLDRSNATLISELFRRIATEGTTVIVATHDPQVIECAHHIIRLEHGRLA